MKTTINFSQFCDGFSGNYKNNFSYEGKKALFNYLEQYEEDTGEEIEFDPIALCCDYNEYENLKELQENYDIKTIKELQDNTIFIQLYDINNKKTDGFIIQAF